MTATFIERLKRISIRHVAAGRHRLVHSDHHIDLTSHSASTSGSSAELEAVQHSAENGCTIDSTSFLGEFSATSTPSDEPSFRAADLPVELWLTILGHIADPPTLAALTQVSRTFFYEAEARLYHTVTFAFDPSIYRFCNSINAVPRRAKLVVGFHLIAIENAYGSTLRVLFPVLQSLRNLEYLTLNISMSLGSNASGEQRKLQAILGLRFPFLRGFATTGALAAQPQSYQFIQNHPFLEELEFNGAYHQAWAQGVPSEQLPALRTLACRTWLLHDNCPLPDTLTHFHATSLHPAGLAHIARLLGKRLVSLRISHCPPFVFQHIEPMSLDEVARKFPRLRFLQLDMEHNIKPYINKYPISFTTTPTTTPSRRERPHARFTLALVYARPQTHAVDMAVAAAWHEFLNRTALQMLRDWGGCVARVVYRHTIIPYVCVALGADGVRLVRRQEREMRDDEWKFV